MISETDYQYCPFCGSKLIKKDAFAFECKIYKHHYYINPRPTNAVIFHNKQGEILLVKRKYPPRKGWWDLPGGFTEAEETMEESVKREIQEELGIQLKTFHYFSSYPNMYLYKNINSFTLMFVFVSYIEEKIESLADELAEAVFFSPYKIPYNKMAFPGLGKAIREYLLSLHKT